MRNIVISTLIGATMPLAASAQFYSVTQGNEMFLCCENKTAENAVNKADTTVSLNNTLKTDTLKINHSEKVENASQVQKGNVNVYPKKVEQKVALYENKHESSLPDLTIPNLYAEIKRNGILYPDIVLAQAILETGWFRSSACRKKNNLFGLTNPRTGKYYEFDHWTDSVRAYYTKVQYRYKRGNYLLWLKKIGYAEDKNYIRAVIKVLKMLS